MERRLQERCAELQREVFRLQGVHNEGYKTLDKRPVALPRQVLPRNNSSSGSSNKNGSFEHEDEGISSSETGQSLTPEPIIILSQTNSKKYTLKLADGTIGSSKDDDTNATIDDVIEELENIVHDAEQQDIKSAKDVEQNANLDVDITKIDLKKYNRNDHIEKEIVPVNLLPQPPKKSRSLAHLISSGSEFEDSDYGILMTENHRISYYDDIELEIGNRRELNRNNDIDLHIVQTVDPDIINQTSSNRELLNVIMNAQENDERAFIKTNKSTLATTTTTKLNTKTQDLIPKNVLAPQKFNGVFFMTEMSTPQKYPRPDITAALEARRVTKSIERMESYGNNHGLDSMVDIIMTSAEKKQIETKNNIVSMAKNNFQAMREMSDATTFLMRNKSPTPEQSNILFANGMKTSRAIVSNGAYMVNGSKLADLPSGLY